MNNTATLIYELQKSIEDFKQEKLLLMKENPGVIHPQLLIKIQNLERSIESIKKQIQLLKSEEKKLMS